MKKIIALILTFLLILTGCTSQSKPQSNNIYDNVSESYFEKTDFDYENAYDETENGESTSIEFQNLSDPELCQYLEENVYIDLIDELDSDCYFIENVDVSYISKEYIEELEYNSQSNIFFGYTLEEVWKEFEDNGFVFTLGDDGQTMVKSFEEYDDTYDQIIRNVAIGTGVILVCVTVSIVSGGVGATAISMIFAASAKSATVVALSGATISGVTSGVVTGIQTQDFGQALKAAALSGSEGYMWGAIGGAIHGGANKALSLKGATLNGLSMNEAAVIQKESKLPLSIIKNFHSVDEFNIYKNAALKSVKIGDNWALVQNIDLEILDENGLTNLQRMAKGKAPLDENGLAYELHHIGQSVDAPLAILTKAEHIQGGNNKILHWKNVEGVHSQMSNYEWEKQVKVFWQGLAAILS